MDTAKKLLGAALFIYAALYILQVIFNGLYANWLDPSPIWTVMNFCSAAGIIISLIVVWRHRNGLGDSEANPGRYLAVQVGFYATLALGIWFFTFWVRLLLLPEGQFAGEADTVVWALISVFNPLVLGTVGASLWNTDS